MKWDYIQEFLKFLVSGFLNLIITYTLYLTFLLFFNFKIAYLFSYFLGIFFSFFLNSVFVFNKKMRKLFLLLCIFFYISNYFISIFILKKLINDFNVSVFLAPMVVIVAFSLIQFFIFKFYFKNVCNKLS